MAMPIVAGSVPVSDHPSPEFTAHGGDPSAKVDPVARALMCCQHVRDCLCAARAAREDGKGDLARAWLRNAEFFRLVAALWHQRARAASRTP